MHLAARQGQHIIMNILLPKGAKFNSQNHQQRTPLHKAVYSRAHEAVISILRWKAEIDILDSTMCPLFSHAARYDMINIIETLGANGIDLNAMTMKHPPSPSIYSNLQSAVERPDPARGGRRFRGSDRIWGHTFAHGCSIWERGCPSNSS